jgi:hypothetical protein
MLQFIKKKILQKLDFSEQHQRNKNGYIPNHRLLKIRKIPCREKSLLSDQVPDGLVHRMERTGQYVDALNITVAPFYHTSLYKIHPRQSHKQALRFCDVLIPDAVAFKLPTKNKFLSFCFLLITNCR